MATRERQQRRKPKQEEPEDNYEDDDYDDNMDNDDDADEAPPPPKKRRKPAPEPEPPPRNKRRKPAPEPDEDADDPEEEDEPPPPRNRKRRKPEPEPEPEPRNKKRRKPEPEPEDDDNGDDEDTIKPYVIPKKYKSCTMLDDGRIRTCAFITMYPALLSSEPSLRDPKVKEYSLKMLFPENVDISLLEEEVEALLAKLPVTGDKKRARKKMWNPLITGDDIEDDGEIFDGATLLKAKSKFKPGLIDQRTGEVIEEYEEVYSGMWARATIKFQTFDKSGHKGVRCQLYNVQKLAEGEPIERGGNAGEDFND